MRVSALSQVGNVGCVGFHVFTYFKVAYSLRLLNQKLVYSAAFKGLVVFLYCTYKAGFGNL